MNDQVQQWIRDQRAIKTLSPKIREKRRNVSKRHRENGPLQQSFESLIMKMGLLRGRCRLSLEKWTKDERKRVKIMLRPLVSFYDEL